MTTKARTISLSFGVERVSEVKLSPLDDFTVWETTLQCLNTRDHASLVIRGKPWPVGSKVDFVVTQVETPRVL